MSRAPRATTTLLLAVLALWGSGPDGLAAQADAENVAFEQSLFDALDYRLVGPYRGGRSTAVAGIAGQPHEHLMGVTGGGVWRSSDSGETWRSISDGYLDVASIGAVRAAPSDPNVIWVGTGSSCIRGNVSTGRGIYRSTDGGETWDFAGLPETGQIGRIAVHPDDPDRAWVAAMGSAFGPNPERGVYRTTDGGESWENVLFVSDSTGAVDLAMNPRNPKVIYAAMWRAERKPWTITSGAREGGIWKTTDGGDSWERLGNGLPPDLIGRIGVTVSPANPDRVWAIIEAKEPHGGVYRSDDAGRSWTRTNRNRKLRQRAWYYTHIHAHPTDPHTVYALNTGLYESVDGGRTFREIDVPHGDVHDLWIDPDDPSHLLVANDGGAQVSVNGGETWTTYMNQPTAELYRVFVDEQFPYRVYGPQQDNSTISLPSRSGGGIHPKQEWYSVGGGESAHIGVDPRGHDVVWATTYNGVVERTNLRTGQQRNVQAYPELLVGKAPASRRYRIQWHAPVTISPHDPDVVYHAAQVVLRTDDGGQSWEEISPDLTRNDTTKQRLAGGPVSFEGAGAEIYNTIFALEESPHERGVIWAGTDDGLVHLTRDGGESWEDVTPDDIPEWSTVNTIEISEHGPGRVFLSVFRYRMDDWAPYVYRTDDYGETWERITDGTNGIPADHPVRVVREDPDRRGLLYAGTEFGVYVSFDDGERWQPFQLDLPVSPITDLRVHRQDLVVATQGRSIWILDDLTPLHELTEEVAASRVHLYQPRETYRMDVSGFGGDRAPESPAQGALFRYYFDDAPAGPVTLEILEEDGDLVRTFSSDGEAADRGGFAPYQQAGVPAEAGMNTFVWNLHYPEVEQPEDLFVWGYVGGPRAVPGTYRVRLTAGDRSLTRSFEVLPDPRLEDVTHAHMEEQFELATAVRDTMNALYDAVETVRDVRDQVEAISARMEGGPSGTPSADSLIRALTSLEEELVQPRIESSQDVDNFSPQLDNEFAHLYGVVAGGDARPTDGSYERFDDLNRQWRALHDCYRSLLENEVAAFNRRLEEAGVRPVWVP